MTKEEIRAYNREYYMKNREKYLKKAKADNFKGWHIHHRLETHTSNGNIRLISISKDELIALDMYYDRPANELIFMKSSDHISLHNMARYKKL